MNKQEKAQIVAELTEAFNGSSVVYLADAEGLSAIKTNKFRRELFEKGISMRVAKNTLIKIAMQNSGKDFAELESVLSGNTVILTSENAKEPAKSIKAFREKGDKPALKGAWIDNSVFIGDNQLEALINLKSKEDLIGDIISLLQSPAKNVISALQSNAGQKIAGLVKALEERK